MISSDIIVGPPSGVKFRKFLLNLGQKFECDALGKADRWKVPAIKSKMRHVPHCASNYTGRLTCMPVIRTHTFHHVRSERRDRDMEMNFNEMEGQ